jgi:tetratricopeptide (TPR) repeat protein
MALSIGVLQMNSEAVSGSHWPMAKMVLAIAGLTLLNTAAPVLAQVESTDQKRAATTPTTPEEEEAVKTLLKGGISKHQAGDDRSAEALFKKALALDAENADAFYNLGAIAESRGDLTLALSDYRAALKCNPYDNGLIAVIEEVKRSMAARANPQLHTYETRMTTSNSMPAAAPSFAVALPANRNQYQMGIPNQTAMSRQLPIQGQTEASRPTGHDLMRAALGVARLLNHDTCSLCGGLLRRW